MICIWISHTHNDQIVKQSFEDAEKRKRDKEEDVRKADPLSQLVTTFCRGAMTERSGALQEDPLYMAYAYIVAKSCGEEAEEDEEEIDEKTRVHVRMSRAEYISFAHNDY